MRIVVAVSHAVNIDYRPMVAADLGLVPITHQGDEHEVLERVASIGSSAWLAFDGTQHVGQLQFRRYEPGIRSPNGVWDPLWWMDLAGHAPDLDLLTLAVCCCHVGQLDSTADRDERYLGRGIGAALLDHLLDWARDQRFAAVIAKATPDVRAVMEFLGGFPVGVYRARGFEVMDRWVDHELERISRERAFVPGVDLVSSTVACCVLRM